MPVTCSVSIISWYMLDHKKSKRIPEKIYFCFTDYTKAFDSVEHNELENSSRDGNTRPSYLLRNLYAYQEATVRTGNGTTDCFQIGKGVRQGCILSPCLFNLYVGFSSVVQSCPTLCDPMDCSTPGFPVHHQLPEFPQTPVHWVGDAIQPSHPLLSPSLLSIFPSIRVFSNESVLRIRWPKYCSFSFSTNLSNEYSGLISFRMDWLDLLEVQGTLKSLLQHRSSKASILLRSAFFMVQLSHLYLTTGKTIALTRWTFVGKVMCLLFKMLSSLVITFLPRSKHLLISWVQSPSAVILEPPPNKVCHCFHAPSIFHEVMGPDAMILVFWMLSFKPIFSLSCFTVIKRLFSRVHHVKRWAGWSTSWN